MPASKDLTGQRFGRLTVIGRNPVGHVSASGRKYTRWDCVCDCGKHLTVIRSALSQTCSCGCARAEKSSAKMAYQTGQRFGKLTVIGKAPLNRPTSNGQKTGWLCICDCGTERVYATKDLHRVRSCGCARTDAAAERIRPDKDNALGRYDGTVISAIKPERGANKNSKTGVKGVYFSSREECYIAKIGLRGKSIYLGRFSSLERAAAARKAAEEEFYAPIIEAAKNEEEIK